MMVTGHWGADCALSMDAAGKPQLLAPTAPDEQPYLPRAAGPRIYVYELPPEFNTWCVHCQLVCVGWVVGVWGVGWVAGIVDSTKGNGTYGRVTSSHTSSSPRTIHLIPFS